MDYDGRYMNEMWLSLKSACLGLVKHIFNFSSKIHFDNKILINFQSRLEFEKLSQQQSTIYRLWFDPHVKLELFLKQNNQCLASLFRPEILNQNIFTDACEFSGERSLRRLQLREELT